MNTDLLLVLLLLLAAVAMFIANRPRMDAVGLLMIILLPFTGVLSINEALAGFADSTIVLLAALFVIGEGLVRTGVARQLGDVLDRAARGSETRLLVLLMVAVAGLGAFMSSTAVVAIFIPVVLRICQKAGTAPSQMMMPLSVAALISGMLTLVATAPNLVVSAELERQGAAPFSFFSLTPFGLPILVLAIGYMFLARRLLPGRTAVAAPPALRPTLREWSERYDLAAREHRVRVLPGSPLAGRRIDGFHLRREGVNLLAIERSGRFSLDIIRPTGRTEILAGDVLLFDLIGRDLDVPAVRERFGLEELPLGERGYFADLQHDLGMVEAIVPPESPLIGVTFLEARVEGIDGLTAIGLRRGREVVGDTLSAEALAPGDTLLLIGFWGDIRRLRDESDDLVVLNLPVEIEEVLPAPRRAPHALAALGLTVGLMVSGIIPNVHAALIGCVLMGALGCVDFASAYRSISWKSLVLIVGMLPFSLALQRTGGVDLAAEMLLGFAGNASPRAVLALIFLLTASLGLFISNTATAVLMAPVALAVAEDLGASPYPFAMTVALAASTAFMTPVSSPVNTLVVGPGNYGFADFVKVGVPLGIGCLIVTVLLVPLVLPP